MAVTTTAKKPEEEQLTPAANPYAARQYQDRTQGTPVSTDAQQLRGVSQNTRAQTNRFGQGYKPGDSVTRAQQALQDTLARRPGDYQSKYGAQLDNILGQITNPQPYKYNFNEDELFKYYADLHANMGRQASMDAMGQAAGLTGGYGNSYAQAAGNQAYQQYLLSLYDKGMDLQNAAYQRYADQQADRYNQLGALQAADQTDYGRYRDAYGDWTADRDYYTTAEEQAYNRDYGQWAADRDYWNQQQQLENADWWNANQFNETMRQNDAGRQLNYDQLNEQNAQYAQNMALQWLEYMRKKGKTPSAEMLAAAGISPEDYKMLVAKPSGGGGGGGSTSSGSGGSRSTTPPPDPTKPSWLQSTGASIASAMGGGGLFSGITRAANNATNSNKDDKKKTGTNYK